MPTQPLWESALPFLFGGAFIEAHAQPTRQGQSPQFPFLLGGTFIEAILE